jgi:DNA polymerase/3'-5' exonuclease PolX
VTGEKTRIPLDEARVLADEVVDLLETATERIAVAGSIRRGRPDVGDVEIVAIPAVTLVVEQTDMFTSRLVPVDWLDQKCRILRDEGVFADRLDKNGHASFGAKYKRLTYKGVPLDLFATQPDQWGVILLLRTGPAEFNQQLVLKRSQGGWLTRGFFFRDGRLWKLPPPYDASLVDQAVAVPTHEEQDVFRALGYRYLRPEERGSERPPIETEATP